jgi:hypothetical protein
VRLAGDDTGVVLDLADEAWRTVTVTADGWKVTAGGPARFRRRAGTYPLPAPVAGGRLEELRQFVNVTDDDWPLILAWLVACLRPSGPYPVLCLLGEQGTAKSTTAKVLRRLIDPNKADLRRAPRDDRDLILAATNGLVVGFDNLSGLQAWLSDALASLATGSGFSTRTLYENDEESIFAACRPVVLNGIEDVATRPDLLDRSLLVRPPRIQRRREERHFWAEFEAARPRLLGALLDAVSTACQRLPSVRLESVPRMADFAKWVAAAEPALGLVPGAFMTAYDANRADAHHLAIEASPVAQAVRDHVNEHGCWTGTAGQLHAALTGEDEKRSRTWPASGQAMAGALKRCAPTGSPWTTTAAAARASGRWSGRTPAGRQNKYRHE